MKKILISFIGNSNYSETEYKSDYFCEKSDLAFIPIYNHFKSDDFYLIGTSDSKWEIPQNKGLKFNKIEIPFGTNEDEFWNIFDKLKDGITINDCEEIEIIFDITHCFRSIPFFVVLYAAYLKSSYSNIKVSHIFYGAFQKNIHQTPLIDLVTHLEILEWINAANFFSKYGDAKPLSELLINKHTKAWKNKSCETKPQNLSALGGVLERVSSCFGLTFVTMIKKNLEKLDEVLFKTKNEFTCYARPFMLLENNITKFINTLIKNEGWVHQLDIANWYYENNQPAHSLLTLRETIITWKCYQNNSDPNNFNLREQASQKLSDESYCLRNKKDIVIQKEIIQLWDKISSARNQVAHALMGKNSANPNKQINEIKKYIDEAYNILKKFDNKEIQNK